MVSIKHLGSEADLVHALQRRVDLAPYQPDSTAPPWLRELANFATEDGGVLAVLGPGGIRTGEYAGSGKWTQVRAIPDAPSVFLAGLADRARETGEKFALGLPPAGRHLPLLLAAAAVMDDTLASEAGALKLERRGVLVISPDLDLRSRYCDLYVGGQDRLNDLKAGARLKPSGERVMLPPSSKRVSRRDTEGGVCFFLPFLELPPKIDYRPSLVVLDLRYARWVRRAGSLASWVSEACPGAGVIALCTAGDYDTTKALRDAQYIDVPFDHEAIAVSATAMLDAVQPATGSLDWALCDARRFLDRRHRVEAIAGADSLEGRLAAIGDLLDQHRDLDDPGVHRARWLLAAMMQLPAPVDYFERAAAESGRTRMGRMIERLGVSRTWDAGSVNADAIVQTLRVELEGVYRQLGAFNPRAAMLQRLLPKLVDAAGEGRVLVLVRDRAMERATGSWLLLAAFPQAEWLDRVDVVACPEYSRVAHIRYAAAIVNGAMPRRYRWITGAALGRQVTYLAYSHEVDVIERQLNEVYGSVSRDARAAQRTVAICADTLEEGATKHLDWALPDLILERPPSARSDSEASLTPFASTFQPSAGFAEPQDFSPFELSLDEGDRSDFDDAPQGAGLDLDEDPGIERVLSQRFVIESRLHGAGSMWLPAEGTAEVVRSGANSDVVRIQVGDIRVGDVVVCMNADGRLGLFDRMATLASEQPEMRYLADVRRLWVEAVELLVSQFPARNNGVDWTQMLAALRQSHPGFKVTSELTLRNWARDEVIGPEDQASIVAVGRVIGSKRVEALAPHLNKAFRRIRGIRQGIGRRLSGIIRRAFANAAVGASSDDTGLDDHLMLPLDELLESVDLAHIVAVEEISEMPPNWLRHWRSAEE